MKRFVLGISGASGPALGLRLLTELLKSSEVHLVATKDALQILHEESGIDLTGKTAEATGRKLRRYLKGEGLGVAEIKRLSVHGTGEMGAPVASGSFHTDGMLVVPCSMKTLSGIANGYANNLITRAADVTIKEGRTLVLSPRETPLSAIHLENMLKLARIGVRIVPPVMGFYHRPESTGDMLAFMAGKILDTAGVEHSLFKRWTGRE